MKKFILSMMIITMTIVGTITANGATKTDKNFRRSKAVCTVMHCKHNHKAECRTHRAWTKPHKHKFNRKNECVKCHLTKREIKKNDAQARQTQPQESRCMRSASDDAPQIKIQTTQTQNKQRKVQHSHNATTVHKLGF